MIHQHTYIHVPSHIDTLPCDHIIPPSIIKYDISVSLPGIPKWLRLSRNQHWLSPSPSSCSSARRLRPTLALQFHIITTTRWAETAPASTRAVPPPRASRSATRRRQLAPGPRRRLPPPPRTTPRARLRARPAEITSQAGHRDGAERSPSQGHTGSPEGMEETAGPVRQ